MERNSLNFAVSLSALFLLGLIVIPVVLLFLNLDWTQTERSLGEKEVWSAVWTSFKGAALSTAAGVVLGVPTAYWLTHAEFKGKALVESLINLPVVIPHVAAGIILLKLFLTLKISIVDTIYAVIWAMFFVSVSYTVNAALSGFRSVNPELIWTARSLGAHPFQTFRLISLPLALPHIVRGALLSFARAISEVGALLIVAYYPKTAPILLYERFENYGLSRATPVAALILLLSFILFALILSVQGWRERSA